ncbi:prolipoprotein diacylglyceryl transferase [Spirulina subsalsa FACHB-351]|uniref:Phosphatidylglycerol--prolipoprotein diacylglyceryl transferase n=1 Tax=Spirulina subsalsa FACHB-351 TaxID=234711 RepID=A0ABT3L3E6_9CYAN|nr:prolipoprotein diacylglyceryl transferase [Spirulina subsalsa]MCW6035712.1 prolipoprotein diacylglyceryl transferase [Spirulina subsalsa FACHB-351]
MFLLTFQSPGPILFELGPLTLRWYGLLIASAVLIGATLAQFLANKRHLKTDIMWDLAVWLVIAAIPCARLYYVFFEWEQYVNRPGDIIAIWQGGIAIHGAMIGAILATFIFSRVNRVSVWQLLDLIAPSAILGQAIGRWGNFFNSEAFGRPTDLPWKLYIPLQSRPLGWQQFDYFHPTFLYESLWNLGVFALLLALFFWGMGQGNRLKVGTLFFVYALGYSTGRLWIEGLRMDSLMLGGLRVAQLVSLGGILIGVLGLIWLYILKGSLARENRS